MSGEILEEGGQPQPGMERKGEKQLFPDFST